MSFGTGVQVKNLKFYRFKILQKSKNLIYIYFRELNFSVAKASTSLNVSVENFYRPNLIKRLKLCDNTLPLETVVENFHLEDLNQRKTNRTWINYMEYLR